MVEASSISNPCINTREKRDSTGVAPAERWRSEAEQRIYSLKLIDALRNLRRPDSAGAVRDAADRVLADSAKGRTRWSRAMLTRRLSLRVSQIKKKHKTATRPGSGFRNPAVQTKRPQLRRKAWILSRLVPGCRKVSLPSLIEETTDYITALQMQVKAMALLNGLLDGAVPDAYLPTVTQ